MKFTGMRNKAEAAARVSGWYTAPVVAVGVDDNAPWLATAFVAGLPDAEFLTTPAVAGGLVFVGCSDDSLYAIQA